MSAIDDRLAQLGLVLPEPLKMPPGTTLPFPWVRVIGQRAIFSGHGPTLGDGSMAQPLGKVGAQVTVEQGYTAARLTGVGDLGQSQARAGQSGPYRGLGAHPRHGQLGTRLRSPARCHQWLHRPDP
jgi:hypothetical protein